MPRTRTDMAAALKVLILLGHPRGLASLCGAVADAFAKRARGAGCGRPKRGASPAKAAQISASVAQC